MPPGTAPPAGGRSPYRARLMTPLLLAAVLNPLNSTMIATSLVSIGGDLGVGAASTAWLVSVLYLTSAVAQPVLGGIADRVGPRRVLAGGLVLVAAAGAVGLTAVQLWPLVVSRGLLGVGTAAAYPSAMALLRARAHATGVPLPRRVLGLMSMAALGSTALGPVLGGLLSATVGWRAIFALNVPLALLALVLAYAWLPRDPPRTAHAARTDWPGVVLFAASLTAVLLFVMRLDAPPWWLLPVAGALCCGLVAVELRRAAPFLDPRLFRTHPALSRTYLRHGLAYLVVYCVMYGWAQWLEEAHGATPLQAGLAMVPMSLAATACSLPAARTGTLRGPLVLAALLTGGGALALFLVSEATPLLVLAGVSVLFGVPQGLVGTGNQAAVYAQAPPGGTGAAAGFQRTSQYLGAMTAAGLIGLFFQDRADDAGLHRIGAACGVLALALLALTATDRALRRR